MSARAECADCARCNDVMLNDNYCPWPNKDDFCKAWTPSHLWQYTFRERLHETLQRALTWERKVKEPGFGTQRGMKKTKTVIRQLEKTELFLKEVNSYIASAAEASEHAKAVLAKDCSRTQEQPR